MLDTLHGVSYRATRGDTLLIRTLRPHHRQQPRRPATRLARRRTLLRRNRDPAARTRHRRLPLHRPPMGARPRGDQMTFFIVVFAFGFVLANCFALALCNIAARADKQTHHARNRRRAKRYANLNGYFWTP